MKICLTGLFLISALCSVGADDLPCAARDGAPGQGQICVCNSTYCDTIAQPSRLDHTQYHMYKTSNSSPGFTHSVLEFTQELSSQSDDDEVVFTIDPSETFQEYEGIGGSITDVVGMLYNSLSPGAQDKFIKSYFGPSGIEYSLIRIPMGSSDFSSRRYTLDDFPFDEDLSHFDLSVEDYAYRIPMIKSAISLSDRRIKLAACTWAAPSWMKIGDTQLYGYVMDKYQDVWAQYHVKFLEAYQKNGLDVWSLSGGNEPALLYILPLQLGTLNCTMYTPDSQAQWLKNHLKPQLIQSNFSQVKLLGLEDQTVFLKYWLDAFKVDSEARAALDGIGLHWYFDWFIPEKQYKLEADKIQRQYPDIMFLYTEGSLNGGFGPEAVSLGSWFRAEAYIYRLFMILDNWNVGYIDWNLALNPDGGPTTSFGIECSVIVNTTSDEFYKQPIFYALGHFSKFIQPGSVKVKVTSNQNDTETESTNDNFDLKDLAHLYSKIGSGSGQPVEPMFDMPQVVRGLAVANPDNSVSVIVFNTKNVTVPVRIEDSRVGSIVLDVEENSIHSFVYWP